MYPAWNDIRADQRQRPVCWSGLGGASGRAQQWGRSCI